MTTKFKVGDKVRILSKSVGDNYGLDLLNSIRGGVINGVYGTGRILESRKEPVYVVNGWFFYAKDLELIKEEEMKFKVGDKVRILSKSVGDHRGGSWLKYKYKIETGVIEKIRVKGSIFEARQEDIYVIDNLWFFARDLELIKEEEMKFKVGDRVKLDNLDDIPSVDCKNNPIWGGNCGHIAGEIYEIEPIWIKVKWDNGTTNCYHTRNLKLIGDEMKKTEYEILEPITAKGLMIAQGSVYCTEFQNALLEFIELIGTKGIVRDFHQIEKKVEPQHIKWLEEKGFIKKKKEEVFYKVGDIFIDEESNYFMITSYFVNGQRKAFLCVLTGADRGNRNTEPVNINSSLKITEKKFEKMCGSGTFTYVKNAIIDVVN